MSSLPEFPNAESGDPDDVSWALETGRSMWAQGDQVEAIRWLKKAADGAEEAGQDMRAVTLAKAAADLRNYVEVNVGPLSQVPPAVKAPDPAEAPAAPAATPAATPATTPATTPPAASSVRPSAAMPPPPQARSDKRPLPPPRSSQGGEPPPSARTPSAPRASTPNVASSPPPSSVPAPVTPRSEAPKSSPDDEQRMTLLASPQRFLPKAVKGAGRSEIDRQDAVRVLLQPVEGKPGVLLVRPMRPGDKPAPGTRAALLVSLDGQALFE